MTLPIQVTNVIKVIEDHLPEELEAVEKKIALLYEEMKRLQEYRDMLQHIQHTVKGLE